MTISKAAFRAGIDVQFKNAEDMWGAEFTRLPLGSHARSTRAGMQAYCSRVQLWLYTSYTAIQRGWTIHEAERFHNRWFSLLQVSKGISMAR